MQQEIPFPVLERDVELHEDSIVKLIQVCWSIADPGTLSRELRGLKTASDITGCTDCVIITFDDDDEILHDGLEIKAVPAWKWFRSNPF